MIYAIKKLGVMLLLGSMSCLSLSCSKERNKIDPGVPRTDPMPAELTSQWMVTTSGITFKYDGVYFGNTGHGVEITMKKNGTGWWNDVNKVATPNCVLVQNLSVDCTFEVHNEDNRQRIYVYITHGTLHEESCTNPSKDIDLEANGKTYPKLPPLVYDYKIVSEDGNSSQKLLLLSQQQDASIRFDARLDDQLLVLKKI